MPFEPPKTQRPANTPRLSRALARTLMGLTTAAFLLLAALAIYGAFLGADHAKAFFNSPPLAAFWIALAVLLLLGLANFPRLLRHPAVLALHLGPLLVLLGALWGSQRSHDWQRDVLHRDKIPRATMAINEGSLSRTLYYPSPPGREYPEGPGDDSSNQANDSVTANLPFTLALNDFWMEYYWPDATLHVRHTDGREWSLPAQPGRSLDLPDPLPDISVLRTFHHLTIRDKLLDDPRTGLNPAAMIEIISPDGEHKPAFVFQRPNPHAPPIPDVSLSLDFQPSGVKEYYSDLVVLDPVRHTQTPYLLEVNHPLHYAGYHFYQSSFGHNPDGSQHTVLTVVSDTGLGLVYAGFVFLALGAFAHCWIIPLAKNRLRRFLGAR